MGFLPNFLKQNGAQGERSSLTVLHVTAREDLSEEASFALRDIIRNAEPADFRFLNPSSFTIIYSANEDGIARASALADALKAYALQHAIRSFGVGMKTGDCISSRTEGGGFSIFPIGDTVSKAMKAAIQEANQNAI
jgi:class 3 adenylate cyclase